MNEFLQSENWLAFQEATGKEVVRFSGDEFSANGIVHKLSLVGEYLYIPRGPVGETSNIKHQISKIIEEVDKRKVKWIRIEPETEEVLQNIRKTVDKKIVKAPHDMQPKEVFIADLLPNDEELLNNMKPKTRYNVRLAEKRGVKVFTTREKKYQQAFLDLIQQTADRKEITPHPRAYYEKMIQTLPEEMCKLFVAEYEGEVIVANLVIIFGTTTTYLHGGSSDKHRDVMAPYLLQWEQMKFAKSQGCMLYDFGGIRPLIIYQTSSITDSWSGITRFKMGFSPNTAPTIFPGAYDIILNQRSYFLYRRWHDLKKIWTMSGSL